MTIDYTWWKEATIYQIWPASYKDTNGDGIGDLEGIIESLNYIKDLGTNVIWLSPMYESPQDDMGYDISDYNAIYHKYGTMQDMDRLISEVHKRGMKIILDLVVNHTSSEHAWFKESRSSKENDKRDWYIWKKPKFDEQGNRHPPNNWASFFGGSAWEYDEDSDEYYLRLFAKTQPDLNWENEECKKAIYDSAIRYWMEKGADGFRIDVAGLYSKVGYQDAPVIFPDTKYQPAGDLILSGPKIHQYHKEINKILSNYDFMTVGEIGYGERDEILKYVKASENEMSMIFLFDLVTLGYINDDRFRYKGWDLNDLKLAIEKQSNFIKDTDAWTTVFIENHDQPRSVTRFGNVDSLKNTFKSAKLLTLFQVALTGTLYIYQGQEIAMTNLPDDWNIGEYLDVGTVQYYQELIKEHGEDEEKTKKIMDLVSLVARDHARSPVQWSSQEYGGFSKVKPWMRVNDNYKTINVESQIVDENSVLSFWKKALALRKQNKNTLIYGDFKILDMDNSKTFTFTKTNGNNVNYIVLNFSNEAIPFEKFIDGEFELELSNVNEIVEAELSPYEGRIYSVTAV